MTIRAFFAVDIKDDNIIREINKLLRKIDVPDSKIKFVAPENLHLTLKFLGDIDEEILPDLQKDVEKIDFSSFNMELKSVGCLPNLSYIKVIYIEITEGVEELSLIAKELNGLSERYNFKKENRPFRAHLTIGRLKWIKNKDLLIDKINEFKDKCFGKAEVKSFKLKKSELTPQGPIYSTVFERKSE